MNFSLFFEYTQCIFAVRADMDLIKFQPRDGSSRIVLVLHVL